MSGPTEISVAEGNEIFSRKLYKATKPLLTLLDPMFGFVGKDRFAMFRVMDETARKPGAKVTVRFLPRLVAETRVGNEPMEGYEAGLTDESFTYYVEQTRKGVKTEGRMTEQVVSWSALDENKEALAVLWSDTFEASIAMNLCSYTAPSSPYYTIGNGQQIDGTSYRWAMGNLPQPIDPLHHIRAGGKSTDEAVGADLANCRMSSRVIDAALRRAKALRLIPARTKFGRKYIILISTDQWEDLYHDDDYREIQLSALQGGQELSESPFFTGRLAMIRGAVLVEMDHLSPGVHSLNNEAVPNTARAVLCGAGACCFDWGRSQKGLTRFNWVTDTFDYGNRVGCVAGTISGISSPMFPGRSGNLEAYGRIVITTAVDHDAEVLASQLATVSQFEVQQGHDPVDAMVQALEGILTGEVDPNLGPSSQKLASVLKRLGLGDRIPVVQPAPAVQQPVTQQSAAPQNHPQPQTQRPPQQPQRGKKSNRRKGGAGPVELTDAEMDKAGS